MGHPEAPVGRLQSLGVLDGTSLGDPLCREGDSPTQVEVSRHRCWKKKKKKEEEEEEEKKKKKKKKCDDDDDDDDDDEDEEEECEDGGTLRTKKMDADR